MTDDVARFWGKVRKGPDCWIWTASTDPKGYGKFRTNGKTVLSHRYSAYLHGILTELTDDACVLHTCDVPACVSPSHLRAGTHADNAKDRDSKGRGSPRRGEQNTHAKLTEAQVISMRRLYSTGKYTQKEIAKMFEISERSASAIIRRYRWPHI